MSGSSGSQWSVSVGISECSLAKGAVRRSSTCVSRSNRRAWMPNCAALAALAGAGLSRSSRFMARTTRRRLREYHDRPGSGIGCGHERGEVIADWAMGVRDRTSIQRVAPLSEHPFLKMQHRLLFEHAGQIDPLSIEDYIALGGYQSWIKAMFDMTPDQVVAEVKTANVRGRGGAGFPLGSSGRVAAGLRSWPKYVVANSHEGEPNVYKDRRLIETNPHVVLEGIMIGCFALENSTRLQLRRRRACDGDSAISEKRSRTPTRSGCSATTSLAPAYRATSRPEPVAVPTFVARDRR